MVYSTRWFVLCSSLCYLVLVFFSPFSIAITSLGEERANLSAFRTCVRFVLVWFCRFPLSLGVWEGLRFVIVALPGLFSYLFLAESETEQTEEFNGQFTDVVSKTSESEVPLLENSAPPMNDIHVSNEGVIKWWKAWIPRRLWDLMNFILESLKKLR